MTNLKDVLDSYVVCKNNSAELFSYADPLQVATKFKDPYVSLICALFAYGNAKLIVKFLNSLDFSLLDADESRIQKSLNLHKYRFQNTLDVANIFITISRLKRDCDIQNLFESGLKNGGIEHGINAFISKIYSLNSYNSSGYEFFFGRGFKDKPSSPYKRYNMYLRWMVRDSDIDLGLFKNIDKSTLLMPLDVHTQRVSLKLGLIKRKSYDFNAVLELTNKLREFDSADPIKYDFALYRIGQADDLEKVLEYIR